MSDEIIERAMALVDHARPMSVGPKYGPGFYEVRTVDMHALVAALERHFHPEVVQNELTRSLHEHQ